MTRSLSEKGCDDGMASNGKAYDIDAVPPTSRAAQSCTAKSLPATYNFSAVKSGPTVRSGYSSTAVKVLAV